RHQLRERRRKKQTRSFLVSSPQQIGDRTFRAQAVRRRTKIGNLVRNRFEQIEGLLLGGWVNLCRRRRPGWSRDFAYLRVTKIGRNQEEQRAKDPRESVKHWLTSFFEVELNALEAKECHSRFLS